MKEEGLGSKIRESNMKEVNAFSGVVLGGDLRRHLCRRPRAQLIKVGAVPQG